MTVGKFRSGRYFNAAGDAVIECEEFIVGDCCYIGPGCEIRCRRFEAGDYLYMEKNVEIGRGGCLGPNSNVTIGKSVFLGADVVINPAEPVTIGDFVGIGAEVGIWTHGAWPNPFITGIMPTFAPVHIGNRVWLTGGSKVLPGVAIGSDAVIGMLSLVNKDVPSMVLAGGVPVKVLKQLEPMSDAERYSLLSSIVSRYSEHARQIKAPTQVVQVDHRTLGFESPNGEWMFNLQALDNPGELDVWGEDFRNFLRRYGFRLLTGRPFKAINPMY